MSSREQQPCDTPTGEHVGRVRPYTCGPRCSAHAPWALSGQPEPKPGPGMPVKAWTTPSPIGDSRVQDNGASHAAAGHRPEEQAGIRLDPGQRDAKGERWIRVPNADYRCPACGETESASGDQVAHFAAHIETEHAARCSANSQGVQPS